MGCYLRLYHECQASHGFNCGQISANMELSLVSLPCRQCRHAKNWVSAQNNAGYRPPWRQQATTPTRPQECWILKDKGILAFSANCPFIQPNLTATKNHQPQDSPPFQIPSCLRCPSNYQTRKLFSESRP